MQNRIQILTQSLKQFFKDNNFQKAVVGVSGGVDSALTLALAVNALGKENVTGILMPRTGISNSIHLEDARNLVKNFGVQSFEVPIQDWSSSFKTQLPWEENKLAGMNTAARIRMTILYHFANTNNAIVLGTGNKTEIELGYGTKYGDFGVDVEVLGELWKTEVFAMAKAIGLPETFYTKAPTAELHENQTDEEEIGASYAEIDRIFQNNEQGKTQTDLAEKVERVLGLSKMNRHKTVAIPVLKSK